MPPKRKRGESSRGGSSRPSSSRSSSQRRPAPAHAGPEIIDVDPETWDIRDPDLEFFVPEVEYKETPGKFSVALHHSGVFFETKYVGGHLTFFDDCHIDHFEFIDLSSMVLKLRYDRTTICEFYYCHPKHSYDCKGVEVGGPAMPIVDEPQMVEFLSVAATSSRLVHVYVVEITPAAALLKKKKDEAQHLRDFYKFKSTGVVIEEIEEPEIVVPKPKPRLKKPLKRMEEKLNKPLMIGWYDKDVEFEEFLTKSLEDARVQWKKDDVVCRNLMEHFDIAESSSGKETKSVGIEVIESIVEDGIIEEENFVEEERTKMAEVGEEMAEVGEEMTEVGEVGKENVHVNMAEAATIEEVLNLRFI